MNQKTRHSLVFASLLSTAVTLYLHLLQLLPFHSLLLYSFLPPSIHYHISQWLFPFVFPILCLIDLPALPSRHALLTDWLTSSHLSSPLFPLHQFPGRVVLLCSNWGDLHPTSGCTEAPPKQSARPTPRLVLPTTAQSVKRPSD